MLPTAAEPDYFLVVVHSPRSEPRRWVAIMEIRGYAPDLLQRCRKTGGDAVDASGSGCARISASSSSSPHLLALEVRGFSWELQTYGAQGDIREAQFNSTNARSPLLRQICGRNS